MPLPRLILPLLLLLLGVLLHVPPAAAQTAPPPRPDSLVREPLSPPDTLVRRPAPPADSLVREPAPAADSLVREALAYPADSLTGPGRALPAYPSPVRPVRVPALLTEYAYVDSLTRALLAQGRWRALDSVGTRALAAGTDYPALRRRLGYAALARQQPGRAVGFYEAALRDNTADLLSHGGLTLAWQALGQRELAGFYALPLADSLRRAWRLVPRALLRAEAEYSQQWTTSGGRGPAAFWRVGVSSQLGQGLTLAQSGAYYGQLVYYGLPDSRPPQPGLPQPTQVELRQFDYQALLTAPLGARVTGKLGYHFSRSRFHQTRYTGHLGYAALRYLRPYWQVQVGQYFGRLTDTARAQTDLHLTLLPLGSLRLYGFGRTSVVRTAGRGFAHTTVGAGGRLAPWLWLDGYAGWGRVPVLAEQDGAYLYNLLDTLQRRLGVGALVPLPGGHWQLRLQYAADARIQIQTLMPYTQHSFTLAASWTW